MDSVLLRRSVRKYDLTKMIPYEELVDLCRYAEAAPSARRQKSREYIIIENKELINKIAAYYEKSTMRVTECNQMIAIIGLNPEDLPCPMFETVDLSCAAENIMIEASSRGIGSVMLGTYPLEERYLNANKLLDLKNGKFVFTFICLGYPIEEEPFYDMAKFDESKVSHIK